jgi:replicative DNA helicase
LDVPVIALAQLNRDEEKSESDTELDAWLKDSGNIEQDSDVIHYLRGKQGRGPLIRKWRIHKERFRAGGINFKFVFEPHIYKFTPVGEWLDETEDSSLGFEIGDNYAALI